MLYKRPNFKMGGSPTGIETLTPRVKAFNGFPGFEFLEPGLKQELRSQMKPPSGIGLTRGSRGARLLTQLRNLSIPGASTTGLMTLPFAPTAAMAYLNRPRTDEALKVMKSEPASTFDETAIPTMGDELGEYDKFLKEMKDANQKGKPISFLDAFLLDPETGTYPDFAGRTEDREKKIKAEIAKKDQDKAEEIDDFYTEGKTATVLPGESVLDAVLREGKVISEKRAEDTKTPKIKDTSPGGEVVEDSFDSMFSKQLSRLEKYLGATNRETKGKVALALSDAVGTPGSLADKAAVLNKALLGIASAKKRDKKELAKLAFAATTELEKADRAAGKKGATEKLIERAQILSAIDKRTPDQDLELRLTRAALGDNKKLANLNQVLAAGKDVRKDIVNYKEQLSVIDKLDGGAKEQAQKTADNTKQDILSTIRILTSYGVDSATLKSLFGDDINLFMAEGGRAKMAVGGAMEASANPVDTKLSFNDLRTRLPQEITDDIVNLIANSEEALQDFAYIRTQGDVEKFNVKYGVNLVLPQDTA
tara:strand:+ start:148 stop:1755 length:1608 start_codon:yes stop_codon:yes gene_type:complete